MLIYSETQECFTSPYIMHAPPTYEQMQTLGGQGWPGLVCVCNSTFLHHKYWFIWFTRNLTLVNLLTAARRTFDYYLPHRHSATHQQRSVRRLISRFSPLFYFIWWILWIWYCWSTASTQYADKPHTDKINDKPSNHYDAGAVFKILSSQPEKQVS